MASVKGSVARRKCRKRRTERSKVYRILKKLKVEELGNLLSDFFVIHLQNFSPNNPVKRGKSKFLKGHFKYGCFVNQVKHMLECGSDKDLKNFIGLTFLEFNVLYERVKQYLEPKKSSGSDTYTCAKEKLMFTLSYLRSGCSLSHLESFWLLSRNTLGNFVEEVCNVLTEVLSKEVDFRPKKTADWVKIADDFYRLWQLPNCLGAIDGKHVRVVKFRKTGSVLHNYKGFPSIILMAVVDAHYRVIHFNVGNPGARSDGGVFWEDNLGRALRENQLGIPPPRTLPGDNENEIGPVPFFFVGDDAFPSLTNLVKPFNEDARRLIEDEIMTNYRISRARVQIECLFGHLARRFRVVNWLATSERRARLILTTTIHLHNFLRLCRMDDEKESDVISSGKKKKMGRQFIPPAEPTPDVVTRFKLHMYVNSMGFQKI